MTIEPFVDAQRIAEHLGIDRRAVLKFTHMGCLPAHPIDPRAERKIWRYKISEIDARLAEYATKLQARERSRPGGWRKRKVDTKPNAEPGYNTGVLGDPVSPSKRRSDG